MVGESFIWKEFVQKRPNHLGTKIQIQIVKVTGAGTEILVNIKELLRL